MTDSANKDSIIKLNTQLNKSVILIENAEDMPSSNRKRKSITIKTEEQPSKVRSSPVKSRKSILKKSNKSLDKNVANDEIVNTSNDANRSEVTFNELSLSTSVLSRPHTVSGSLFRFNFYCFNFDYSFYIIFI